MIASAMADHVSLTDGRDVVTLAPFDPKQHQVLMAHWLQQPHVQRGWGDPAKNLAEVLGLGANPRAGQALIVVNDLAVGYLHWQPLTANELAEAGITFEDDRTIDIDIFIGEAVHLGRGVGPAALHLLMQRLRQNTDALRATLFTGVENHTAIRAYEKAGFQRVAHYHDVLGWTWVMMGDVR